MTEELHDQADRKHRHFMQASGVLVFLLVFVVVASMLVTALLVYTINNRGKTNSPILQEIRNYGAHTDLTLQRVIDCSTPGHACYQRGQDATKTAITQLNKIIVLASYCAKQPENVSVEQIQTCVVKGLG